MLGTILNILVYLSLIATVAYPIVGYILYKRDPERFNNLKGWIAFVGVGITLFITIFAVKISYDSIQSSTDSFKDVTTKFQNVINFFNRRPDLKVMITVEATNDTAFEIVKVSIKNDGNLTANVHRMKIEMPNKGFIKNTTPWLPGFQKLKTYDKYNDTYQQEFIPTRSIIPPDTLTHYQSIDINRMEILYDKHLNETFRVLVYYRSLFGYDGLVVADTLIYKP